MKFVKVDQSESGNSASQDHYLKLLSAVDGVVSPFSTMILEGALCGKKILCFSFSDTVNQFDFSITNTNEHLQTLMGKSWVEVCDKSKNLEEKFANFIASLDADNDSEEIKASVKEIVYYEEHSYSDRLLARMKSDFSDLL
jgi:hypothetical protein